MGYKIGITGTGSLIGQAIIKSIKRNQFADQYELVGFDYFKSTVGSFWCDKNYTLPDLLKIKDEQTWVNALEEIIVQEKIVVLFVGVDFELPILAKYKERLKTNTGCTVIVSDEEVIRIGNDKYLTFQFLKANGLSYPETFLPEEVDFSTINFPIIVKPRVGARSIGVHKVNNIDELNSAIKKVDQPIIQELVGNDSTEYTCGVLAVNGTMQKSIALNRSLKDGNTFISEYKTSYPPSIYQYLADITHHLKIFGACNYQLRLDDSGVPKLFEINPRHSGTTYMRSLFGYNEVMFILKYLLEGETMDFKLKEGKVIRHFEETLVESRL